MEVPSLLSLPEGLCIEWIHPQGTDLSVGVVSVRPSSCCPLCAQASSQVHSQYQRTLRDVPCGGRSVVLRLSVRKFFCRNPDCPRRIFTERLPPFVQPHAQVTTRLFEAAQAIGLATSGELGTRLAGLIGIHTSPTTMLRRIMALAPCFTPQVSYLGIDDWSFRRRRKYGTILVDLTTHTIIDLLPDRRVETSAAWMRSHPEIEIVSRDRGEDYAAATRLGAPQATQCADRFHVLKNLGEDLEGVLARHLAAHRTRLAEESRATPLETLHPIHPPKLKPKQAELSWAKREERLAKYEQIVTLRQQGLSQTAIAERVGVAHSTVSRWLRCGAFPEQQPRPRKMELDSHLSYLRQCWEAGCHNIAQLYRELVARGYTHSYWSVYEQLVRFLPEGRKNQETPEQLPHPPVLARQAVFLFLRRPDDLEADEQETLAQLRSLHSEVDQAYELVQQFAQMLRTRTGEQLDAWLEKVRASQISELQRFVASIERDKTAVVAGLTLPLSNGVVEGKVNKLKLIKRMGFGRTGFPLLRQRVLHAL
ncbi:ISL3 family transposase [Ktedonobacter sp. SOSP1-85]|uniref:ISL3 family transposase n=1 Tax=Ktedonobacter sp. SOSP1-85 TaxID=2778367 RepID=UPI001915CC74|nr:ISL3 family transposase [Ktedonobacter sp. SOSP1-85]